MKRTCTLIFLIFCSHARLAAVLPNIASLEAFSWTICLEVPAELGNQDLAKLGLVDVTAAPFYADPAGKTDSTNALQHAIDFARDHQMVCFFPEGIYRISDTLQCRSKLYRMKTSKGAKEIAHYDRLKPCYLLGSTKGRTRPRIVLTPGSAGYNNPKSPKYVMRYSVERKTDVSLESDDAAYGFNYGFIGIDMEIGANNPGAIALRLNAAEGATAQDCTIHVNDGLMGIEGSPGSGGSSMNVSIIGGETGIDLQETREAPVLTGFQFINQRGPAVFCSASGPATMVGCEISKKTPGAAIVTRPAPDRRPDDGRLSMIDCKIDLSGDATGIDAQQCLYLENVFIKGSKSAAMCDNVILICPEQKNKWLLIKQFAWSTSLPVYKNRAYGTLQTTASIFINRKAASNPLSQTAYVENAPQDLRSRHLWNSDTPCFETPGAINVKAKYNATGDGIADDTTAIQTAINENKIVFLPKGRYRITKPLELRSDTRLTGIAKHITLIENLVPEGKFANPKDPQPIIKTSNDAEAETILCFVGTSTLNNQGRGAYQLLWQCGPKSIFREVLLYSRTHHDHVKGNYIRPDYPDVIISGNGGGKFYNFMTDGAARHPGGQGHRHLLIHDNPAPIRIYHGRFQHGIGRHNVEIRNSRDVVFYGLKSEGQRSVLQVTNCDNFRLYGYSGNATMPKGETVLSFENVANLIAAQIGNTMMQGAGNPGGFMGSFHNPREWSILKDIKSGAIAPFVVPPLERPLLYQRTN